ncbi:MAG TPA: alcohol dehydrogenase catalytic domain-containing protein [Bacillales bacterium]|nr:alcohol dehydrogenase catalytic domain-containing protein [Bacillales bacterium]
MSEKMRAVVYEQPETISLQSCGIPEPESGWAIVKVHYCGICGTDLNIYGGGHPRAKGPLVLGHEFAGEIVSHPELTAGAPVTARPILSCGTCSSCLDGIPHVCENLRLVGIDRAGGMAEYVSVPADEVFQLPASLSIKQGALIEPYAVAVHAVRKSKFKPGDQCLVFGAGPIGLCTAYTLRHMGVRNLVIVEVHPFRRELAEQLGFAVLHPQDKDFLSLLNDHFKGGHADVVFDCAAHPSVASILPEVTKVNGQIVLVGTYKQPAPLDLQSITFKEISITGTRVYTKRDYEIALDLMVNNEGFDNIITHEFSLQDAQKGFDALKSGNAVKVLITM